MALKRSWIRGREIERDKAEFEVLKKMARRRHRHIIELIGFYILPGRPDTELGLLVWPVARLDRAHLLAHLDLVRRLLFENFKDQLQDSILTETEDDNLLLLQRLNLGSPGRPRRPAGPRPPPRANENEIIEGQKDVLEDLSAFTATPVPSRSNQDRWSKRDVATLYYNALPRLRTVYGCLAEAINCLHNEQKIQRKDLKPSQVLLSPKSL